MYNQHRIVGPVTVVNSDNPHTIKYQDFLDGNVAEKLVALNKFQGNDEEQN